MTIGDKLYSLASNQDYNFETWNIIGKTKSNFIVKSSEGTTTQVPEWAVNMNIPGSPSFATSKEKVIECFRMKCDTIIENLKRALIEED